MFLMRHGSARRWVWAIAAVLGASVWGMAMPASWSRTVDLEVNLSLSAGIPAVDLLAEAEQAAQGQIASTFETQPDVTEVKLYVLVNYAGQLVPIVMMQVERSVWQQRPQVRLYSRPLRAGITLLGLNLGQGSAIATSINTSSSRSRYSDDPAFRDD
jgi:hypothetical protein